MTALSDPAGADPADAPARPAAAAPGTPDTPADTPTGADDRHASLDVLRGVAVLMIFTVNVRAMLQPFFAQSDPQAWGGPRDLAIDRALQFAVDGKWIAVFAILFGAGLALLHDRAVAAGIPPNARIVRRQLWLLAFGVVHMAFIWLGDVLVTYAITGLVLTTVLGAQARKIATWAALSLACGVAVLWGLGQVMALIPPEEMAGTGFSVPELIAAEVAAKSGGIGAQLLWRAEAAGLMLPNAITALPFVFSYMAVGVLAFRSGFLLARWPVGRYLIVAALALPAAWAIDAWRIRAMGVWDGEAVAYDIALARYMWAGLVEGLLGGIGYAALVMAAVRAGLAPRPLAAAGRMAFTNYVLCSVVGTTLAAGHGADLLGDVTLAQAMLVVGAVWLAILTVSPLWLGAFRYGPLEWAWRSLSYGRTQPMVRHRG